MHAQRLIKAIRTVARMEETDRLARSHEQDLEYALRDFIKAISKRRREGTPHGSASS